MCVLCVFVSCVRASVNLFDVLRLSARQVYELTLLFSARVVGTCNEIYPPGVRSHRDRGTKNIGGLFLIYIYTYTTHIPGIGP